MCAARSSTTCAHARASRPASASALERPKRVRQRNSRKIRAMRRETAAIAPIAEIIAAIRASNIVILVDDEDRENEGDLVFAAEFVTAEKINFLATHGRGLVCMPITEAHAQRLGLRPMVAQNRSRHGTNFTASIEAAEGIATGISAHDRALTVKVAAAENAKPEDIVQPGHVFPLIAQPGGVLVRAGHTEAC